MPFSYLVWLGEVPRLNSWPFKLTKIIIAMDVIFRVGVALVPILEWGRFLKIRIRVRKKICYLCFAFGIKGSGNNLGTF